MRKKKKKKKHGPRWKIPRCPGAYVERDKRGRFKEWTRIGRSIPIDTAKKAKKKTKTVGHGHRKDLKKKPKKKKRKKK